MSNRIMIAGGLLLAFVIGTMAAGFYTNSSNAFNPPITNSFNAPQELSTPAARTIVRTSPAVPRTQYVAPRAVATRATTSPEPVRSVETPKKRTLKKSAMIVGGSAGAGAAIGAVSGGKKGAAIGAVSGGVAGLIYDMATRNKN
jgi:hypothetical protein